MRRLRDERGFTLIEMIVVCALLGTVLVGLTAVFVSGSRAELGNNNRFKAQETARVAMDSLRLDVHRDACAANVPTTAKLVLARIPTTGDVTQCGAVGSSLLYPKEIWCALTSPTITGQYALYRSTATDSSCTLANGTLVADGLTSNVLFTLSTAAPIANCAAGTICVQQLETVSVTIPVSFKQGTQFGVPYTVAETLALRNGVYQTTNTTTPCTTTIPCIPGSCPFAGATCYPPAIQ
jgi:prepilin-type N-terminal cleavage/methylation domain-containing protein